MRVIYGLLISILVLQSCKSIEVYNASIKEKKSIKNLRNDVDVTYYKLKKLHPHLYQYIPKDSLDFAFERLKKSITEPLTPQEFHKKLAPVVKKVGQGHLGVYRPYERLEKEKRRSLKNKRFQFYALSFEYADDGLFVKKVNNYDTLVVGNRMVKVDEEPIAELFENYKQLLASDGYNTTFYNRFIAQHFNKLYSIDKGFRDSIQITFAKGDSLYVRMFRYVPRDSMYYDYKRKDTLEVKQLTKAEKKVIKAKRKQQRKYNKIHDFNPSENNYNRNFKFIGKDSSVAYMKIRSFSGGKYKPFYKASFDSIRVHKSQNLIIDLRDNNGGSLQEINIFYSYLVQEPFRFINEAEVNSRIHTIKSMVSSGNPTAINILSSIFTPLVVVRDLLKTHKIDGKLYYKIKQSKLTEPMENNFDGDIYVLINGSSFSASSVISANLQATQRATFVGEETGGAYNGTVAGKYKIIKLPASKVRLRVGLLQIETPYNQEPDGYGIKPDAEIVPTKDTLEKNKDSALEWILNKLEE